MIAIDTNILLRYLLRDDPKQSPLTRRLLESAWQRKESIYISSVVLCEALWTLQTTYRMRDPDLLATAEQLLSRSVDHDAADKQGGFVLQDRGAVRSAADDFALSRAEFSDHLIGRLARAAGATTTYTFDRRASASPYFKLLERV